LKYILWIPAAVVIVAATIFAVVNRGPIPLDFWPLPYQTTLPLSFVLLAAVAVGVLFGGIAAWWAGRDWRRLARQRKFELEHMARELAHAKRQREQSAPAPQPALPGGAPFRALAKPHDSSNEAGANRG